MANNLERPVEHGTEQDGISWLGFTWNSETAELVPVTFTHTKPNGAEMAKEINGVVTYFDQNGKMIEEAAAVVSTPRQG